MCIECLIQSSIELNTEHQKCNLRTALLQVTHSFVLAAGDERVLIVQHEQALHATAVAHKTHQVDEVEVEGIVLLTAANLVLPIRQPILLEMSSTFFFARGFLEGGSYVNTVQKTCEQNRPSTLTLELHIYYLFSCGNETSKLKERCYSDAFGKCRRKFNN